MDPNPLPPIAATWRETTTIIDDILARLDQGRQRNLDALGLLRAYYFEVVNNLEILEAVNLQKLHRAAPNAPSVKAVVQRLSNETGALILFDTQKRSSQAACRILERGGRGFRPLLSGDTYRHVLKAVSFTIVKTEILRRMTTFSDAELEVLKDIRVRERLENLRERYLMVKEALDTHASIRILAR